MRNVLLESVLFVTLAVHAGGTEIWTITGNNLVRFDSAAPGNLNVVGPTGGFWFDALDFSGSNVLYGYQQPTGLYWLNIQTGAATFIRGGGLIAGEAACDLAWNPATQTMYLTGAQLPDTPLHLYTVNLTTGFVTLVGEVAIQHPDLPFGLASNAAGTLYVADGSRDGMYRLAGLGGTFLGPEGFDSNIAQGMTIDWSRDGAWYHGAFNATTQRTELWTVNETTGVGTFVGLLGTPGQTLVGDLAIMPVPEPTALLLMGVLVVLRRR